MNDLREILRAFGQHRGQALALASLVRARGSSFRRPGARLLICADGSMAGSLSAGCLEEEVALVAREVMQTGVPRLLTFDTRRRFGCHGSIEIFVERVGETLLEEIARCLQVRQAFQLATKFAGEATHGTRIDDSLDVSDEVFVQAIEPAIRLLIIGDGPDSAALTAQAELLGWEVSVRASIADWLEQIDGRTAAVIATHNYGRDCAALRHLLPLGLPYVGLIGPRRRREELLLDVLDSGAAPCSNLFAPAGLHLGADGPAEIALSIIAEIQRVFAAASGASLRERRDPIHEPPVVTVG